jgi:uncharacterized membrane protein HdeD (DUF308 family)
MLMSVTNEQFADVEVQWDLATLRRGWGWLVTTGAALVLMGTIALVSQVTASLVTAAVIGGLLIFTGVAEIFGAYWSRHWSGFFLKLLSGALLSAIGALFFREPVNGAIAMAMLLAGLLMTEGIFRVTAAGTYQFEGWGWGAVSGSVDLLLGMMIWLAWPAGGLWMLGLFVGISLMFRGFNWIGLGVAVRTSVRAPAVPSGYGSLRMGS